MRALDSWQRRLSALLIAALLAACGGGGGGSTSAVTTPPATPTPTPSLPPGAPSATGDTALDGYNWFNYRRGVAGVSVLARNSLLDAAAAGHSNYLRLNNTISHEQISGNPGFTGQTLGIRLTAAGYTGASVYGEVISGANDRSGFYHAEELITAIYHRFVIFEPVFKEMGTGAASSTNYTYFTTDFAARGGYGPGLGRGRIVVYPADGQTMVPTSFLSDTESPDPVPNQNLVGYPVSVHADLSGSVSVQGFTIRQRGAAANLTVRLLARSVDSNTPASAAAIVPLTTLAANSVYDVSFSGTVDGTAVSRNWSFTTK